MKYRKIDKYKYQLAEAEHRWTEIKEDAAHTHWIHLLPSGRLWIRKGYCWNGSNWSIDYKSRTASLYRDALYQLMRLGLIRRVLWRKYADELYRDILIEIWINGIKAKYAKKYAKKGQWQITKNILKAAEKAELAIARQHINFRYTMLRKFGGTSAKLTCKPENVVYEE